MKIEEDMNIEVGTFGNISASWMCIAGGFFRRLPKNSRRKNSNSRKMEQKLKDFFPENSRNRKFLCKLETKSILFDSKIDFLGKIGKIG